MNWWEQRHKEQMMQEADSIQTRKKGPLVWRWATCILAYGFSWAYTFNLLWTLESNGLEYFHHLADFGRVLLPLAWSVLCPDWPFLAMGLVLGLLTSICTPKSGGMVKPSLLWSLLPAAAVFTMFGLTPSGLLPALIAVAASYFAATIIARAWQQVLFSVPFVGRPLAPKRVIVVLVWLLALSIPFRLFELLVAAWSRVLPAKITETQPVTSPDGAYVAVIHNVDPNINDYSDVIIRPRYTLLNLFQTNSASARYMGIGQILWTGRHTLCIWRSYDAGSQQWHDAGQEQWHDVRIIYKDSRSPDE